MTANNRMSDSEEEVDEATAIAYQLLEAEFEDCCRRLKLHESRWAAGDRASGPAPLSLAEEFEQLATRVRALGADEDDAEMCAHFAAEVLRR